MQKIHSWFQNKFIVGGVVAVVLIGGGVVGTRSNSSSVETVPVTLGTITQGISVTGKVVASDEVKLGFETTGRVSEVLAQTGEMVTAGETLVRLSSGDVYAKLLQAQADLETEQAKLSALKRGSRPEELAVSEVKVANAKVSLEDAKHAVLNAVSDSYTKSDDAIRNKVDQFMSNPRGQNPKLTINADPQLAIDIESKRRTIENALTSWQSAVAGLSSVGVLSDAISTAETNLSLVLAFLDNVSLAINALSSSSSLSQTTLSGYKTDVLTARTNINTAISALATAKEKLRGAESSLSLAETQLDLDKAGATEDDLMAEEARVKSAEANVANYESQLAKTVIHAPFDGVVTLQDGKVGQIVTPGTIVTSVSGTELIIEAFVPEVDIAQVAVGNTADVSLDAYGSGVIFPATVFSVDPAETLTDGVSTYKIKLRFVKPDARIKSGMTANVDATTVHKDNVLVVPTRAVLTVSGKKIVQVQVGKKVVDTEVQVGARGVDGMVEITKGLSVGDMVVLPAKK
ncbi:MAG: hypothetical protein RLZZ347_242 [Candidatus Parcubacteria bacterium]|jgi:HlyD family secretion protein